MKYKGVSLHVGELTHGAFVVVGLAERFVAERADLIGADHNATRIVFGNSTRFGNCQTKRKLFGCFTFKRSFIDTRGFRCKRIAQTFKELAAVARGGGKNKVKIRCHATNCIELAVFSHQIFFDK